MDTVQFHVAKIHIGRPEMVCAIRFKADLRAPFMVLKKL